VAASGWGGYIRLGVGAGPAGRGHWPRGRGREAPCRPFGRAVPVPCHGPGRRPMHYTGHRAVPARARGLSCRAARGPCQKAVPWAVSPAHGPHGHIYNGPLHLFFLPTNLCSSAILARKARASSSSSSSGGRGEMTSPTHSSPRRLPCRHGVRCSLAVALPLLDGRFGQGIVLCRLLSPPSPCPCTASVVSAFFLPTSCSTKCSRGGKTKSHFFSFDIV